MCTVYVNLYACMHVYMNLYIYKVHTHAIYIIYIQVPPAIRMGCVPCQVCVNRKFVYQITESMGNRGLRSNTSYTDPVRLTLGFFKTIIKLTVIYKSVITIRKV